MGLLKMLFYPLVVALAAMIYLKCGKVPPLPHIDPSPWWGPGQKGHEDSKIRPFKIEIPQMALDDFKARLALDPRVSSSLIGTNFSYGVNKETLEGVIKYWKTSYDWRKREKLLNSFQHFKTQIEGLDIHFMRSTPPSTSSKKVLPLLIVHGWPGSFVEFYDIIPLLTSPQPNSDVIFDVIVPSIPGYGFSQASSKPGLNTLTTAQIFVKLMERLGYNKFYAQGGDWGSAITSDIATAFPDRLFGLHLNMVMANTMGTNVKLFLGSVLPSGMIMDPKLEEKWYPLKTFYGKILREMGYMHLHATKPDTVGVALNSSPQGLLAYILEKFSTWTDEKFIDSKDGGLLNPKFPIKMDKILDNICIYWFTGSISSSMRFYAEFFTPSSPGWILNDIPTDVPTGIAAGMRDLAVAPENFAAHKYTNIVTYTNPDAGHFFAMENPELLAKDIHNFVNLVEKQRQQKEFVTKQGNKKPKI